MFAIFHAGGTNLVASGVHASINMLLHHFEINICPCTSRDSETGGHGPDVRDHNP